MKDRDLNDLAVSAAERECRNNRFWYPGAVTDREVVSAAQGLTAESGIRGRSSSGNGRSKHSRVGPPIALATGTHRAGFAHEFFCESDPYRRGILEGEEVRRAA